ncbi:hypothetical protein BB776_00750 [Planococcus salinarum]|uniref:Uncharacterized protein n=1 Tax=Planococcus salinarum TaxID=622695 RepID=A0ABX3D060_9BACL|nr:hypothetical protein [Planococcus salinarum]OHX51146.1 hypothetical protein BB776_00750 [Planococcus salinarum]TAA69235.1 hypothetical protein D2909_13065 [Planococcus salinarum]
MNWIILFFIVLGITGVLLLFYGIKDKSLALLLFGIGALIAPILFYTNLAFLMPMIPAVVMGILYFSQKKSDTT